MTMTCVSLAPARIQSPRLTANSLKWLALFCMVLDHTVTGFLSHETPLAMGLHVLGRLAAPIMCYFIAEGFYHSKNIHAYLRRLLVFALVSHLPYAWYFKQSPWATSSVMTALFLGLLALYLSKSPRLPLWAKVVLVLLCCLLARPANWNYVAVLWIVVMGQFHGQPKRQMWALAVIGLLFHFVPTILNQGWSHWYQAGFLLAIPLLLCYKGERGSRNKWVQRGFYLIYPLHLLILLWARDVVLQFVPA